MSGSNTTGVDSNSTIELHVSSTTGVVVTDNIPTTTTNNTTEVDVATHNDIATTKILHI